MIARSRRRRLETRLEIPRNSMVMLIVTPGVETVHTCTYLQHNNTCLYSYLVYTL